MPADAILTYSDYRDEQPAALGIHLGKGGFARREYSYAQYLQHLYTQEQGADLPPQPTQPPAMTWAAFVDCGRWLAQCPGCRTAIEADFQSKATICVLCGPNGAGWVNVSFPRNKAAIESELLKMPGHRLRAPLRKWRSGWSMAHLEARTKRANELQALLPAGTLLSSMSIGSTRVWTAGEVLLAANENTYISDVLDDLAGRDGPIELEDSLEVGGDYLKLPSGTTAARPTGVAARVRYNTTLQRAEYHNGTTWVSFGAPIISFEALNAAGDVGLGATQLALGNHTHVPAQVAAPTLTVPSGTTGRTRINVSWDAPAFAGSSAITGYDISYRLTGQGNWTTATSSGRTRALTGLDHSSNYEVRVRAKNSTGAGEFSPASNASTATVEVPQAPSRPTLTPIAGGFTVRWVAPNAGTEAITSYELRYRVSGTVTWTNITGLTSTSRNVTGLSRGQDYDFEVRARSSLGAGPYSPTATATVSSLGNAAAPTVAIDAVPNGVEGTQVSLSATLTGGAYDTIAYEWSVNGGVLNSATAQSPTWTRPALNADANYTISLTVTVRGTGRNAIDDTSATRTATRTARVLATRPSAPNAPTLTVTPGWLTVTWNTPSPGDAAITGYTVRLRVSGTTDWTEVSDDASPLALFTGTSNLIAAGNTYEVQVRATSSLGNSPWSASATSASIPAYAATPTASRRGSGGRFRIVRNSPSIGMRYRWVTGSNGAFTYSEWILTTAASVNGIATFVEGISLTADYQVQYQAYVTYQGTDYYGSSATFRWE